MNEYLANIATLDLGSNSFHLLIAGQTEKGFTPLMHKREAVRLQAGLDTFGSLDAATKACALRAITQFAVCLQRFKIDAISAVATAAFRQAPSLMPLMKQAEVMLQTPIRILTGEEEARLIYQAVIAREQKVLRFPTLVIDIGGGSTELVLGHQNQILALDSLNLGAISLQQRFFPDGNTTPQAFHALVAMCQTEFSAKQMHFLNWRGGVAIATSGLAESIGKMGLSINHTAMLTRDELENLAVCFFQPGWQAAALKAGQSSDKILILPVGLGILIALMQVFDIECIQPSAASLREGVAYQLIHQRFSCNQVAASIAK